MRVRLGVLLAAVCGTLSIGATGASAALEPCERAGGGRSCAILTVPLDRAGAVPGTVELRIERRKAKRATRPPLFLLAGGPGQSATDAYHPETVEQLFGTEIRSRDVVVMDMRGTGRSGALDCPTLQRGSTRTADVAACAAALGPRRDFYSSVDMADDVDAVRAALGVDRIAIYGASYGTYVAQVYARRHPTRVERLVLDAVVGPQGVDPFERSAMAAVPGAVARLCGRRRCRSFMRDPRGDAGRLAARLDREPLTGYVVGRDGRRRPATIDGQGLLELMAAVDGSPLMAGTLTPGAIRSALRGDSAPLLRTHAVWARISPRRRTREASAAAYVATLCSDTLLPWHGGPGSPFARRAAAERLVAAQPPGAFAPFGPVTALRSRVLETCRAWPRSSRAVADPATLGALPDVPALLLSGGLDTTTPTADARAVAAQLPQATVVELANGGHGTLTWDFKGCAKGATRRFLAGGEPGRCGPGLLIASPYAAPPASLRDLAASYPRLGRFKREATILAVFFTVLDASVNTAGEFVRRTTAAPPERFFALADAPMATGALRGGRYALSIRDRIIRFQRASAVGGVRVSGRLRLRPRGFTGSLRISGRSAPHGRLTIRRDAISGKLDGRRVRVKTGDLSVLFGPQATAADATAGMAQAARLLNRRVSLAD